MRTPKLFLCVFLSISMSMFIIPNISISQTVYGGTGVGTMKLSDGGDADFQQARNIAIRNRYIPTAKGTPTFASIRTVFQSDTLHLLVFPDSISQTQESRKNAYIF